MWRYLGKRLLEVVPTTMGILLIAFLLFNVVGGSPALAVLGKNASAESVAAFNHRYGYDKPLIVGEGDFFDSQFFNFVKGIVHGDWGYSSELDEPVADIIKRGVGPSLSLTVPILALGTAFALVFALLSAAFRGGAVDRTILAVSTVLMSVNYVVWVLAGQYIFSYQAGAFPVWGYAGVGYLVLPVLIGVVSSLGVDIRFFRTALLDEIYKPYVLTARAKGLSRCAVMIRHVLPNALIAIVTYVSLAIPYLFTGSLLLENFFGIPGLGAVAINAINSSDMAVVRAVVVIGALVYQFVNLATDMLYALLDPRVRLSR